MGLRRRSGDDRRSDEDGDRNSRQRQRQGTVDRDQERRQDRRRSIPDDSGLGSLQLTPAEFGPLSNGYNQ